MSQRARQINERREDPNSRFIHDLGYALTPFGLLPERTWFQTELQAETKAIAACRRHLPPDCPCWKEARENLYSVRQSFGEKSPESWAALRVWEALDEIELSPRPAGPNCKFTGVFAHLCMSTESAANFLLPVEEPVAGAELATSFSV